jgi:hypothetical protein
MTTFETYRPVPFSTVDYRGLAKADDGFAILKKAFLDRAPNLELDLGHTDTGIPFVTVTDPAAGFDAAPPCVTRAERGWQMHRGGNGPLYEFETEREIAEFLGSRMIRPRWCAVSGLFEFESAGAFRRSCASLEVSG